MVASTPSLARAAAFFNDEASGMTLAQAEADIKPLVISDNQAALDLRINDSLCTISGGPASAAPRQ